MKRIEQKALNATIDYVDKSRNCFTEMHYDSLSGMEIKLKRYADKDHPLILEGTIDIIKGEPVVVGGMNNNFVNYIKEKLK